MKTQNIIMVTALVAIACMLVGCDKKSSMDNFEVTQEWANGRGSNLSYVIHDSKYYTVGDGTDLNVYNSYNIGWKREDLNVTGLYCFGDYEEDQIFTCGDIEIPTYTKGDQFVSKLEELTFQPVEFVGYGVPFMHGEEQGKAYFIADFADSNLSEINVTELSNSSLRGEQSGIVGYYGYSKNEKVSFYAENSNGEKVYDYSFKANCRWFEKSGNPTTVKCAKGDLFNSYDLSTLAPGTYFVNETYGLITIE